MTYCASPGCFKPVVRDDLCGKHVLLRYTETIAPPAKAVESTAERWPMETISWKSYGEPVWGTTPAMTLHRSGKLLVSAAADRLLGTPSYVGLLYCDDPQMIGIYADHTEQSPGTRQVHRKSIADRVYDGFYISCKAFLSHYEIDRGTTRRWEAVLVDTGLLAVRMVSGDVAIVEAA